MNGEYKNENVYTSHVAKYDDYSDEAEYHGEEGDDENQMQMDEQYYDDEEAGAAGVNGSGAMKSDADAGNNGALDFECVTCEKRFKYFCYYKRHMDACHSEWPKYVCDTCNKSYKWEASFRQHLRSHHNATMMPPNGDGSMPTNGMAGEGMPSLPLSSSSSSSSSASSTSSATLSSNLQNLQSSEAPNSVSTTSPLSSGLMQNGTDNEEHASEDNSM